MTGKPLESYTELFIILGIVLIPLISIVGLSAWYLTFLVNLIFG